MRQEVPVAEVVFAEDNALVSKLKASRAPGMRAADDTRTAYDHGKLPNRDKP